MDCPEHKLYPLHGMDSRAHLETYFTHNPDMGFAEDSMKFPNANLQYVFSSGHITGDVCIDISGGSFVHQLCAASRIFKEIIILKVQEQCIMELKRWLCDRTGAFHWADKLTVDTQFGGKSDHSEDHEERLKETIKQVRKCNFDAENISEELGLPLADCVITAWALEIISNNHDNYMRNIDKISNMMKIGAHLIVLGVVNATYFVVGEDKIHILKCSESFIKTALCKAGFVINFCALQNRRNLNDLIDYEAVIFITACKEK